MGKRLGEGWIMRCGQGCGMGLGHGFDDRWVVRCEEGCDIGR